MTAPKGSIKERLSRYREIKLSVTGRKSGKTISIPVWYVLEGDKLYLLPRQIELANAFCRYLEMARPV